MSSARLILGNCLNWLGDLGPVDAIVTAPPVRAAGCATAQEHQAWMARWREAVAQHYGAVPVIDYAGPSLAWAEHCIAAHPEWRVILDPFMGQGRTGAVALRAHREFIGIEIDRACFNEAMRLLASQRLE